MYILQNCANCARLQGKSSSSLNNELKLPTQIQYLNPQT